VGGRGRPRVQPGGGLHHAMPDRAAGFCIYNDPAVAIDWLLEHGAERVAYVDVDVHHGDGVEVMFRDDPRVLTISLHESGRFLFPGTGAVDDIGGPGAQGSAANLPLHPGTTGELWLEAFDAVVDPLCARSPRRAGHPARLRHPRDRPARAPALTVDDMAAIYARLHRLAHERPTGAGSRPAAAATSSCRSCRGPGRWRSRRWPGGRCRSRPRWTGRSSWSSAPARPRRARSPTTRSGCPRRWPAGARGARGVRRGGAAAGAALPRALSRHARCRCRVPRRARLVLVTCRACCGSWGQVPPVTMSRVPVVTGAADVHRSTPDRRRGRRPAPRLDHDRLPADPRGELPRSASVATTASAPATSTASSSAGRRPGHASTSTTSRTSASRPERGSAARAPGTRPPAASGSLSRRTAAAARSSPDLTRGVPPWPTPAAC
jgi:hypothetical protein